MAITKLQAIQENLTAATGPSTLSGMPFLGPKTPSPTMISNISLQVRGKVRVK